MLSSRYLDVRSPLNRLLNEASFWVRCSDDKTAVCVRPRNEALRRPYMQVNRPDMTCWLVFDIDHSNLAIWEDLDLPVPNMIVANRTGPGGHLFYAIRPVCTSERARSKPISYMQSVYRSLCRALRADPDYRGPVAKTPGHPWWRTVELHNHEYELAELDQECGSMQPPYPSKAAEQRERPHSRHCALFDVVRMEAYRLVESHRRSGSYENFYSTLLALAEQENRFKDSGFASNLSYSQVKATVKSIARWTWSKYQGRGGKRRGVMQLPAELDLVQRQQASAMRSNQLRRSRTATQIRDAIARVEARGDTASTAAVAREAGLSRQTVHKYRKELNEGHDPGLQTVNDGVHQIPSRTEEVPDVTSGIAPSQSDLLKEDSPICSTAVIAGARRRPEGLNLAEILSAMLKIPKADGYVIDWSREAAIRVARVVSAQQLGRLDTLTLLSSVLGEVGSGRLPVQDLDGICGYTIATARKLRCISDLADARRMRKYLDAVLE